MTLAATLATACYLTQVGTAAAGVAGECVCPVPGLSDAALRTQFGVAQGYLFSFEETWWHVPSLCFLVFGFLFVYVLVLGIDPRASCLLCIVLFSLLLFLFFTSSSLIYCVQTVISPPSSSVKLFGGLQGRSSPESPSMLG